MTVQHVHRDVIVAWANGQKVEFYAEGSGRWVLTEAPTFDLGTKYRIYDKYREIKAAHAGGRVIHKLDDQHKWVHDANPTWDVAGTYRVAPDVYQQAVKLLESGHAISLTLKCKPNSAVFTNRYYPDKLRWFYQITWDVELDFVSVQPYDIKHCTAMKQARSEGLLLQRVISTEGDRKTWRMVGTPDWDRADGYRVAPSSLQLAFDLLKNMPIVVTEKMTGEAVWFAKGDTNRFLTTPWVGDEFDVTPDRIAIISEAYKQGELIQVKIAGTDYWKLDVPPFYSHSNREYRIAPDGLQQAHKMIKEGKYSVIVTDNIGSPPYKFMRGGDIVGTFFRTEWKGDQYGVSTYNPHAELIAAYSNGFAIDTYCSISKTWKFCDKPLWLEKVEYRKSRKEITEIVGLLGQNRYVCAKLGSVTYILRGAEGIAILNGKDVGDNVEIEYTVGHVHAEAMRAYAEDAMKTDTPWKLWEYSSTHGSNVWHPLTRHPLWGMNQKYRRISK